MITGRRRSQRVPRPGRGPLDRRRAPPSYADLLDVVGALRAVPAPEPDPAFVLALRERLVEEARDRARRCRGRAGRHRRAAPAAAVRRRAPAVATAGSRPGSAASSSSAPPARWRSPPRPRCPATGSTRSSAASRAPTPSSPSTGPRVAGSCSTTPRRGSTRSRSSAARAGAPTDVSQTLDAFTQEAIDGSDLLIADYQATGDQSSITSVRTFTAASMARLRMLQRAVPADSVDALLQAAQALDQVQQVAARACPTCAGPSVDSGAERADAGRPRRPADSWLVALPRRPRHTTSAVLAPAASKLPTSAATCRRPASPTPRRPARRPGAPDRARRPAHPPAPHRRADRQPAADLGVDGHRHRDQPARRRRATSATRSPTPSTARSAASAALLPTLLP